jgi:hypothetical protein
MQSGSGASVLNSPHAADLVPTAPDRSSTQYSCDTLKPGAAVAHPGPAHFDVAGSMQGDARYFQSTSRPDVTACCNSCHDGTYKQGAIRKKHKIGASRQVDQQSSKHQTTTMGLTAYHAE